MRTSWYTFLFCYFSHLIFNIWILWGQSPHPSFNKYLLCLTQSCLTLCDPWTVAHQAPPSTGFSRQEYWSGLPCPSPGYVPNPGIEPVSLMSPALAGRVSITSATWEALAMPVLVPFADSKLRGEATSLATNREGFKNQFGSRACAQWLLLQAVL